MASFFAGITSSQKGEELANRLKGKQLVTAAGFSLFLNDSGCSKKSQKNTPLFFSSPRGFCLLIGSIKNASDLQKEFGIKTNSQAELIFHLCEKGEGSIFSKVQGTLLTIVFNKEPETGLETTYVYRSESCEVPFFWSKTKPFAFSTQLKDLICLDEHILRLDHVGLASYLHLGFCPVFLTPLLNIDKLVAGCVLTHTEKSYFILPANAPVLSEKKPKASHIQVDKTIRFSWESFTRDIWESDLPTSTLFFPYLLRHKMSLSLKPIAPEKKLKKLSHKWPFWRGLSTNFPPFSYLLWLKGQTYPVALRDFENSYAIFSRRELQTIAPYTYSGFDLPSFMRKIFSQKLTTSFSINTFFDFESRNLSHLFDSTSTKHCSLPALLSSEKWLTSYLSAQDITEMIAYLKEGILVDQDILTPKWLDDLPDGGLGPKALLQVWSLATLEMWLELFFEGVPSKERLEQVQKRLKDRFAIKKPEKQKAVN